ncbi:MAG TPA: hypothetical protein VLB76_15870 [Thermoanaerobaculia bacterium]|nr:hypothetical protein [Thermoanaerobaculia bacterium]
MQMVRSIHPQLFPKSTSGTADEDARKVVGKILERGFSLAWHDFYAFVWLGKAAVGIQVRKILLTEAC